VVRSRRVGKDLDAVQSHQNVRTEHQQKEGKKQ
jgi:hypothetical protein